MNGFDLRRLAASALVLLTFALCACGSVPAAGDDADSRSPAEPVPSAIRINELMASNKAILSDGHGAFPDWAELYNSGSERIELEGYTVSDGEHEWRFPALSAAPGEYILLFFSKDGAAELTADFSLSSGGETLSLYTPDGQLADSFRFGESEADTSFIRAADGAAELCLHPSPGYENSDAGYAAFQASRGTPALSINEVVVFTRSGAVENPDNSDWVELKNSSSAELLLSDYFLSDSFSEPEKLRLPERVLAPGELFTVLCDAESGFSLAAEGDELYLTRADGGLTDYVSLRGIPVGGSCGRMPGENGFFYFAVQSMSRENEGGARLISDRPELLGEQGVFEDTEGVRVELCGRGEIYYTLDGSLPTENALHYTEAFTLEHSAAVRAVCIEPGRLASRSLDLSYIINEGHSLPVTSIVVDPEDMFSADSGIYANPLRDWERPAHVSFFDGEDSFDTDCGIKIHGATSRINRLKKSCKLVFRDAYGGQLHSELFKNGVTEFNSLLVRNGQESSFDSNVRDIAFHELAAQCCPALSNQAYRYSVLYINGEYWGIYALREAHSAGHYARHSGYDPERTEMFKERWDRDGAFEDTYRFILTHDMADDENFRQAAAHIDLDALTAWMIVESFSGNFDINEPNVRFYYTQEDGVLHYALVDVDFGFFEHGRFANSFSMGTPLSEVPRRLLDNASFRAFVTQRLSEYLHGPLSEENVSAVLDGLTEQLRPEIARDGARWGFTQKEWENEVQFYMYGFSVSGGERYTYDFAKSARSFLGLSNEQFEEYFGDLK